MKFVEDYCTHYIIWHKKRLATKRDRKKELCKVNDLRNIKKSQIETVRNYAKKHIMESFRNKQKKEK
jgi:hypothetical protein